MSESTGKLRASQLQGLWRASEPFFVIHTLWTVANWGGVAKCDFKFGEACVFKCRQLSLEGSIVSHVYVVLPALHIHYTLLHFISDLVLYTILNIHTLFRLHNRFVLSLYVIE